MKIKVVLKMHFANNQILDNVKLPNVFTKTLEHLKFRT